MARIIHSLLITTCLISTPLMVTAQEEESGGMLVDFLEDTLSGDGRSIKVTGLVGALSAKATIEQIAVSDDDGVWLTINNATLDWNRLALLTGSFSVNALTAEEILIARAPLPSTAPADLPSPETTPFQLPELPVAITLGEIRVDRLGLGEPLIGLPAELKVAGSLVFADGALDTDLGITRLDRPGDVIKLAAEFANETQEIGLDLQVIEDVGGLISTALKIPDQPPLLLTAKGAGPVRDFTADIGLSSGDAERISGQVRLRGVPTPDGDEGQTSIAFSADLGGDLTPFFEEEFDTFFGTDTQLGLEGRNDPDGHLEISELRITSDALAVKGEMAITAGELDKVALQGRITPPSEDRIVLPLSGPRTTLKAAQFSTLMDRANGNQFDLSVTASGVETPDMLLDTARINASGTLNQGETLELKGDMFAALVGLNFTDPALAQAIGHRISLDGLFDLTGDGNLQLSEFELEGTDYSATADAKISGLESGLEVDGNAQVTAADLSRFSKIAGQDLSGKVGATVTGKGAPLTGSFDFKLDVDGQNLGTGMADIDPLIAGQTKIALDAVRDDQGLNVRRFALDSAAVSAEGGAKVKGLGGALSLDGTLKASAPDLSLFSGLAGQDLAGAVTASVTGNATPDTKVFDIDLDLSGQDLRSGIAELDNLIAGKTTLLLDASNSSEGLDIRNFDLAAAAVKATAKGTLLDQGGKLGFQATLDDLNRVVPNLSGPLKLAGDVSRTATGFLGDVKLTGPQSSYAKLNGTVETDGNADLDFDAEFAKLERILPELAGALNAKGSAKRDQGVWTIDADAKGPSGVQTTVAGTFDEAAGEADITAKGSLSLGIANLFVSPNKVDGAAQFDLALRGKPGLDALSGTITTSGTTMAIPSARQTLTDIGGTVSISDSSANLAITAGLRAGGTFQVSGPVELSPPFQGRIAVGLNNLILTDNVLFDSSANGQIVMSGPLAGNSSIAGQVIFGETNINLAAAGGSVGSAPIPEISHIRESGAVRTTRKRANLIKTETAKADSKIALDISLQAPNKVFVRGRGLNAELGGNLHIGGTTSAISPSGQIELVRGNLDILGRRLKLTKGIVTLQGNLTPYVEFASSTSTEEGLSTMEISGPLNAPEIKIYSDPERPTEEALAMLLFGNRFSQLSPIVVAQMAASLAQLSGAGGDSTKGIRDSTGVDSVDISADSDGTPQFGAGKYLADGVYTDFTVNTQGDTEVNLNLDLTDSWTAKGTVDNEGDTSIGLFFERDY
ncbi:translocation/assembly module TamB domain-containing protein [Phaeobacter sp. NW0010-22]|uniref:translocation/assembly module TamB domain-containing protein n=1 Tax=Phaeobacter sp. NW0010-22 TaxID=3135907 RepID=UPI003341193B